MSGDSYVRRLSSSQPGAVEAGRGSPPHLLATPSRTSTPASLACCFLSAGSSGGSTASWTRFLIRPCCRVLKCLLLFMCIFSYYNSNICNICSLWKFWKKTSVIWIRQTFPSLNFYESCVAPFLPFLSVRPVLVSLLDVSVLQAALLETELPLPLLQICPATVVTLSLKGAALQPVTEALRWGPIFDSSSSASIYNQ